MDSPTNRVMEVYGSEWEEDMDGLLVRVHSEEDVAFWWKLTLPQEEKDPVAPKWGTREGGRGYRWFRSPNVVCFEHYRRAHPTEGRKVA
jgi:hypothetical protein